MLITPKLLKDIQADILASKIDTNRREIADDQESAFCAVVGKRKITLYAKPARGKRVKLGELGETYDDQRTWVKSMRDRATALRAEFKQKNGKKGKNAPATPADLTLREYLDYYYKDTASYRGVRDRDNKSQKDMRSCFSILIDRKMGELGMEDLDEWQQTYGQAVLREDGLSVEKFGG